MWGWTNHRLTFQTKALYKIWEAHVVIHKSPGSNQKLLKTSIWVVSTGSHFVLYLLFNMQPLSCGTRPTERLWNDLRRPLTIRYRIYNLKWRIGHLSNLKLVRLRDLKKLFIGCNKLFKSGHKILRERNCWNKILLRCIFTKKWSNECILKFKYKTDRAWRMRV